MRTRLIVLAGFLATLALGVVAGAYFVDRAHDDTIAPGVRVNDVAIGGLKPAAAEAKLRRTLLDPLARPIRVKYRHRHFTLTPRAAAVGMDIHGTVARALARSRQGSMFSRAWRDLRGNAIDAGLAADVTYSQAAIDRLVRRVQRKLNRPARSASVDLEHGSIDPTPSSTGRRVKFNTLRKDVTRSLLDPGAAKTVKVHTKTVEPAVSSDELAAKYPAVIMINRSAFTLRLYKHLKLAKTYPIAVGMAGLETPAGLYHIENKEVNPSWHVPNSAWAGDLAGKVIPPGPDDPIKARWMGIYAGAGIHGTDEDGSIGSAASHGCIRMHIPDVIDLYDRVSVGDPVYIA
jgi:lipoprotein-anchoring transpeptidase ErfK/SrfK